MAGAGAPLPEVAPHGKTGILGEILGEPKLIKERDSRDFALAYLRAFFRDGDIATAIEATYWAHARCRVGVFPCSELGTTARRVGALVPLVPSADLRPTGMDRDLFESAVSASLVRLEPGALPPDEPELPYDPKPGEALFRFLDHHLMPRALLLVRAGTTWKVVFIGSMSALSDVGS